MARNTARGSAQKSTKSALSRELIQREALQLIEAEGMDAFSVRQLGERLGCQAMSIYHHFESKAHILDSLVDLLLSEMKIPPRSQSPERRLRSLISEWRALSRRQPRFYVWLAIHRWNSQTGIRYLSEVLDCFYDAGLDAERAARAFRAVGYYVLGATLDETSGYVQGPSSLEPLPARRLASDFPRVAAAGEFFAVSHFDKTFELGLNALLVSFGVTRPDLVRQRKSSAA